jgi:hypothetical protein
LEVATALARAFGFRAVSKTTERSAPGPAPRKTARRDARRNQPHYSPSRERRRARRQTALAARRELRRGARKRNEQRQKRSRVLKRLSFEALGVALCLVAGMLASGSGVLGIGDRLLPISPILRSYEVAYRTVYPGAAPTIEQYVVDLPIDGLYLVRGTGSASGRIEGGTLTDSLGLFSWRDATHPGWALTEGGLHPSAEVLEPARTIDLAIRHLEAGIVGSASVLGHTCTIVETGAPPGEPMSPPTSKSSVDLCFARSGIVLFERWYLNGRLAESKTAVSYIPHPRLRVGEFAPAPRASGSRAPVVRTVALDRSMQASLNPKLQPFDGLRFLGAWVHATGAPGVGEFATDELYGSRSSGEVVEVRYEGYRSTPPGIRVPVSGGRTGYLQLNMLLDSLTVPTGPYSSIELESPDPTLLVAAARHLRFAATSRAAPARPSRRARPRRPRPRAHRA